MSMQLSNKLFNSLVGNSELPQSIRSQLFVGTYCNYKCEFCYYKPHLLKKNSPEKVYEQMRYIEKFGVKDIEFTGGEPTIDSNWFHYLDYGKKLFRHLSLITNGQKMAKREFAQECYDHGLREVLFSLHGYDKASHEKITGIPGSWEKILKAIENAKYIGFIVRTNTTVCSINYKNLDKLALKLRELKPLGVNFIPLNYWDGADESGVDVPYHLMAPHIKYAIDILKGHSKYINVRYIPYCHMGGYEEFICNWHQHSYDYWDWHNSFKKLPELDYREARPYVDEVREHIYAKKTVCLTCKYRGICDGVEKKLVEYNDLKATTGELIKDPMHFRKNYCTLNEYNEIIYAKN